MDAESLRDALERVGLTSYQAEAYLTLLEMGTAPAVEVGRKCSVPVSQIYEVLRDLEDEGYVETMEQEKLYAQPADPEAIRKDLRDQSELLADASEAVKGRYQRPELMDHRFSVVKQPETAVKHAIEFLGAAETVIEIAATVEQLRTLLPALRTARERGVVVRATVCPESDESIDAVNVEGAVSELRECWIPGPLVVIVDRHRVCYAPNTRSDERYGIIIRDRLLPVIFHWHFLTSLWNLYPQVYVADDGFGTYVTIEEFIRDTYQLWQEGYALDVAVGGVDPRTDEDRVVSGTVEAMRYPGSFEDGAPRLTDLAGYVTLVVNADDGDLTVGGWGALFEDIEMHRLELVDVVPPSATPEP